MIRLEHMRVGTGAVDPPAWGLGEKGPTHQNNKQSIPILLCYYATPYDLRCITLRTLTGKNLYGNHWLSF